MTNEYEALVEVAVFGAQVQQFLDSQIGKFLVHKANLDRTQALEDLVNVDPHDFKKVQDAQNRVHRAESIQVWLEDCVNKGLQAINVLDERQQET